MVPGVSEGTGELGQGCTGAGIAITPAVDSLQPNILDTNGHHLD